MSVNEQARWRPIGDGRTGVMGYTDKQWSRVPDDVVANGDLGAIHSWIESDVTPYVDEMQRRVAALAVRTAPPPDRPDWHSYFLAIAAAVATRADCTRRQVGAVLVGPDRRVLSTGYNGAPSGVPGCATAGACPRGRESVESVPSRSDYADGRGACLAIHAEQNAVMYSRPKSRAGATMYVTCEPCPQCYALLEACGITDVRWPDDST